MKIFIGCHEIANFLTLYSNAFKSLGHEVETFVFDRNNYYLNNRYDFVFSDFYSKYFFFLKGTFLDEKVLRRVKRWYVLRHLKRIIHTTDVFVFIWSSLLPSNEDLAIIKKHRKKIIFVNCGNEVRHSDPFVQEFNVDPILWKKDFPNDPLEKKLLYLRNIELYADLILSVPDQSGLAIRPYFHLKIPYDSETIQYLFPNRDIPHVVHCPTRRFIKGSDIIEDTLKKLEKDGVKFHYKKLTNVPNTEILKILTDSDVVVDQLLMPGPGVLGFEAMSAGCVVCTRHIPNLSSGWIPPVVAIDAGNIYQELKLVLTNKEIRRAKAKEGKDYVEKNHKPEVVAKEILQWLEGEAEPHYFPRFYLDGFIPQDEKVSEKLQNVSQLVLMRFGCSSYTDLEVAKRHGLIPSSLDSARIKRWKV